MTSTTSISKTSPLGLYMGTTPPVGARRGARGHHQHPQQRHQAHFAPRPALALLCHRAETLPVPAPRVGLTPPRSATALPNAPSAHRGAHRSPWERAGLKGPCPSSHFVVLFHFYSLCVVSLLFCFLFYFFFRFYFIFFLIFNFPPCFVFMFLYLFLYYIFIFLFHFV